MKNSKLIFILILLSLALAGCKSTSTAQASTSQSMLAANSSVVVEGHLMPQQSTDLAFTSTGRVAEVLVKPGDNVTAGQTLARLEMTNLESRQADLARAQQEALSAQQAVDDLKNNAGVLLAEAQKTIADDKKQLDDVQKNLDKAKTDGDELIIAQVETQITLLKETLANNQAYAAKILAAQGDPDKLAAADARLTTAKAALLSAQAALKPIELQAPWAGSVADTNLVVGQYVTPGEPVVSLADVSSWVVKTDDLTELKLAYVKMGEQVSLTFDALPGVNLDGTVVAINPKYFVQNGDITYTATIALTKTDPSARWGMTASIRFEK